eukprot:TRINITY_DN3725_c1_g1_i1.p1 TRINITY_DN3725_c1_g1~~TRINITY_DN3725_c1_g1_i1.p1  ORF type:complete len:273 (+),score=74.92 TRINITY_DN3725_c1_g1_i1:241-1059(+)
MERVQINVGGTLFVTTRATLLKAPEDSPLHLMANSPVPMGEAEAAVTSQSEATSTGQSEAVPNGPEGASFFLDRPPEPFRRILNALRVGLLHAPEAADERALLLHELCFYALEESVLGSIEVPFLAGNGAQKGHGWARQVLLWRAAFSQPRAWRFVWCRGSGGSWAELEGAARRVDGKEVLVCASGFVGWARQFKVVAGSVRGEHADIQLDRAHFFGAHRQPEPGVLLLFRLSRKTMPAQVIMGIHSGFRPNYTERSMESLVFSGIELYAAN